MAIIASPTLSAVILAGGQSRRMGGEDKGLMQFNGITMVAHVIHRLSTQVDHIVINANRNISAYQTYSYPVIKDALSGFLGPLAGIFSAMETIESDYILTCPCDVPYISPVLRQRLMETLLSQQADIAVASDGKRLQPVFSLIPTRLKQELKDYLQQGHRKIDQWFNQYKVCEVDFSDQPNAFININRPEDINKYQSHITSPIPLLGLAAYSGTGKTTLLKQLIPLLKQQDIHVAVIKHAHHQFDIDKPGKDSYEIRQAGAEQVLVSSTKLMALMQVKQDIKTAPNLAKLLPRLDTRNLDLIIVEGFKRESFAKIELHRAELNKPLLYPEDDSIIAIASDSTIEPTPTIAQLDLNNLQQVVDFIAHFIATWTPHHG